MASNTEILKVSLKDYKKEIDNLKAQLLGLNRSSAEYAKTLSELQEKQQKLNQVTRDAKRDDDALEGSYNALVASMARLKEEWRATNDVAKRNELGQQIESINTQLKEFDLSIGNSQRNVGNYEGATVSLKQQLRELNETMTNMLASGIKETDPAFVELAKKAGSIKDAMMDAKAATKQYADDVRGMSIGVDVAKNLAAGYGTLTSAMQLFGASTEDAQKITAKMTTVMTLLNSLQTINKAINDSSSPTRKLLIGLWERLTGAKQKDVVATTQSTEAEVAHKVASQGATTALQAETVATEGATVATNGFKKALIATGIGAFVVLLGTLIAKWDELKDAIFGAGAEGEKIKRISDDLTDSLNRQNTEWSETEQVMRAYGKSTEEILIAKDKMIALQIAETQAMINATQARYDQIEADATWLSLLFGDSDRLQKLNDEIGEMNTTLGDLITQQENVRIALKVARIEARRRGGRRSGGSRTSTVTKDPAEEARKKAVEEGNKAIDDLVAKQQTAEEKIQAEYDETVKKLTEGMEAELKATNLTEEQRVEITKKYNKARLAAEQVYQRELEKIIAEGIKYRENAEIESEKKTLANRVRRLQYNNSMRNAYTTDSDQVAKNNYETEIAVIQANMDSLRKQKEILDRTMQAFEQNLREEGYTDEQIENIKNQSETYNQLKQAIDDCNESLVRFQEQENVATANYSKNSKKEKKEADKRKATFQEWSDKTVALIEAVASADKANIEARLKNGEITQKQAEKEFERVKAMQIATSVAMTIAGGVAAFMKDIQTYMPPQSYAIAAIDMATTLAQGYAQVRAIQSQSIGSASMSNVAGGQGIVGVRTQPLLEEELDSNRLQSVQLNRIGRGVEGNQRVYVLESDLQKSDKRVEVRQQNTTF